MLLPIHVAMLVQEGDDVGDAPPRGVDHAARVDVEQQRRRQVEGHGSVRFLPQLAGDRLALGKYQVSAR